MAPPELAELEAAVAESEAASQPLVPVPTLKIEAVVDERARHTAEGPTLEITHIDDDDGEFDSEERVGASSVSAQVVPIRTQGKRKRRAKKPRAEAVEPRDGTEHVMATQRNGSGAHWLLFAVAASAALWLSTRAKPEQAQPAPIAAREPKPEPLVAEEPQLLEAAPAQEPKPEPVAAEERKAIEPVPAEEKAIEPAPMPPPPAPTLGASDTEPARLTAYKTVMSSTNSAAGCRHRGDSSGKVSVVVEFGSDGRVQRTDAKGSFANPMTRQCIVSKFSTLSIPTTLPAPIIITADVTLR